MRAVVEECAGALSSAAEASDVKVLMSLPKGEVQGSFDPMLLTRALSVLLKNAIEVTPSGGTVRIDMGDGDDTIDCSISDGGPGLSIEDCGRLVEGFFNGTQGEGTGVGVVIARRIAERYGGILRAEPGEDGTGSTVHFIIRKVREIS
jgi:two-component system sensor histidine kinase TctE